MQTITHSEFAALLAARKGAFPLSIKANTAPKVRKTGNPYAEIRKESYLTVITGADYEKGVIGNGGRDFKAEGLPYGKFTVKNKVVETETGKLQLRTQFRNRHPKPIKVEWYADGTKVEKELVSPYVVVPTPSAKQASVGVTGRREVKVRNYDFANIREVVMGGETYRLIPDEGAQVTPAKTIAKKSVMRKQLADMEAVKDTLRRLVIGQMNHEAMGARQ